MRERSVYRRKTTFDQIQTIDHTNLPTYTILSLVAGGPSNFFKFLKHKTFNYKMGGKRPKMGESGRGRWRGRWRSEMLCWYVCKRILFMLRLCLCRLARSGMLCWYNHNRISFMLRLCLCWLARSGMLCWYVRNRMLFMLRLCLCRLAHVRNALLVRFSK